MEAGVLQLHRWGNCSDGGLRDEDMWWLVTPRNNAQWQCLSLKMPHSRHLHLERSNTTGTQHLSQGNRVHNTQLLSLDSGIEQVQGSPGAKILGLCCFDRSHWLPFTYFFFLFEDIFPGFKVFVMEELAQRRQRIFFPSLCSHSESPGCRESMIVKCLLFTHILKL